MEWPLPRSTPPYEGETLTDPGKGWIGGEINVAQLSATSSLTRRPVSVSSVTTMRWIYVLLLGEEIMRGKDRKRMVPADTDEDGVNWSNAITGGLTLLGVVLLVVGLLFFVGGPDDGNEGGNGEDTAGVVESNETETEMNETEETEETSETDANETEKTEESGINETPNTTGSDIVVIEPESESEPEDPAPPEERESE